MLSQLLPFSFVVPVCSVPFALPVQVMTLSPPFGGRTLVELGHAVLNEEPQGLMMPKAQTEDKRGTGRGSGDDEGVDIDIVQAEVDEATVAAAGGGTASEGISTGSSAVPGYSAELVSETLELLAKDPEARPTAAGLLARPRLKARVVEFVRGYKPPGCRERQRRQEVAELKKQIAVIQHQAAAAAKAEAAAAQVLTEKGQDTETSTLHIAADGGAMPGTAGEASVHNAGAKATFGAAAPSRVGGAGAMESLHTLPNSNSTDNELTTRSQALSRAKKEAGLSKSPSSKDLVQSLSLHAHQLHIIESEEQQDRDIEEVHSLLMAL